MDKATIHNLIDKVIGKKGLLRIPSWWMRKVLMQIVDWVQEGDDANEEKIVKVKEEVTNLETNTNSKISSFETTLNNEISYLKNLSLPYMLVSGTGIVNINGKNVNFSNANNQLIYITGPINFSRASITDNEQFTSVIIHNLDIRAQGNNMERMLGRCINLSSINIRSLYTYGVTNMMRMFESDKKITSLDLSSFDTSSVTAMHQMFYNCPSLTSLDLSSFDTSSVTTMYQMFTSCSGLTSLILGPNFFKTPNITSIDFSYCSKWTNDTVVTSLVTNSYNRATAGLNTMTLQLSANTKAALTDEQKATITAKGYTIA